MNVSTATHQQPRRGRPPKVDRQQVVDAAVQLVESESAEALSLRGVAARLGVGKMTLYSHVQGIDELRDLVVTELFDRWAASDVEWPSDWESALTHFAHSRRAMLLQHPLILDTIRRQSIFTPRLLRDAERVFAAFRAAGLEDEDALDAWVTLHAFVYGFVSVELARAAPHMTDGRIAADRGGLRDVVEAAPEEFPNLLQLGERTIWAVTDEQFDRSLSMVIASLGRAAANRRLNKK
jgi:AcrR family transcriptional regulator